MSAELRRRVLPKPAAHCYSVFPRATRTLEARGNARTVLDRGAALSRIPDRRYEGRLSPEQGKPLYLPSRADEQIISRSVPRGGGSRLATKYSGVETNSRNLKIRLLVGGYGELATFLPLVRRRRLRRGIENVRGRSGRVIASSTTESWGKNPEFRRSRVSNACRVPTVSRVNARPCPANPRAMRDPVMTLMLQDLAECRRMQRRILMLCGPCH